MKAVSTRISGGPGWSVEATEDPNEYASSSESYGNCSASGETQGYYISGEGDCFTLYGDATGEREGCEHESVSITSGCLTEDGIENKINAHLFGTQVSQTAGACESLVNEGLLGAEGERDVLEFEFVERVED